MDQRSIRHVPRKKNQVAFEVQVFGDVPKQLEVGLHADKIIDILARGGLA